MGSIFKGIKAADARKDANYVIPCHIIAKINACRIGENRKGEGFFVVEMTTLYDCAPDKFRRGEYGHEVGEDVSHMMMQKHDSFLPNVKAMIANTLDMDPDDIGEEEALAICNENEKNGPVQPLKNTIIEIVGRNQVTKKGGDFTVVNYKGEVKPSVLLSLWQEMEEDAPEDKPFSAEACARKFFPDPTLAELIENEDETDDD